MENKSNIYNKRHQWFEKYFDRLENESIRQPTANGRRYDCPCCGYPTLEERGGFEICELCQWEDDGQDDPHAAELWGGPNGEYTLAEARSNFKRFLVTYNLEKASPSKGNSNTESVEHIKRNLMEFFDSIAGESDTSKLADLWQNVGINEQLLHNEIQKRKGA